MGIELKEKKAESLASKIDIEHIKIMNEEIKKYELEIAKAFNAKPKNGITKIVEICQQQGIEPEEQIAKFFYAQKNNLDLEAVGDYLSGPEEQNKKVTKEEKKISKY